jgi:hypothetical protein
MSSLEEEEEGVDDCSAFFSSMRGVVDSDADIQ